MCGERWRSLGSGSSVAKAKDAKVSIIKLIHNNWIGLINYFWRTADDTNVTRTATIFTVNWNWTNFLIESKMFLPHKTALTMEEKLSSIKMMDAAPLAT